MTLNLVHKTIQSAHSHTLAHRLHTPASYKNRTYQITPQTNAQNVHTRKHAARIIAKVPPKRTHSFWKMTVMFLFSGDANERLIRLVK